MVVLKHKAEQKDLKHMSVSYSSQMSFKKIHNIKKSTKSNFALTFFRPPDLWSVSGMRKRKVLVTLSYMLNLDHIKNITKFSTFCRTPYPDG